MIYKVKKIGNEFIHTSCDGEMLYQLGLKPQDIIGKRVHEFFPAEFVKSKQDFFQKAWAGEFLQYETRFNNVHYLTTLRPMFEDGKVVEIVGTSINISEIKAKEEQIRETEMLYRSVVTTMMEGILILEQDGKVTPLNENVEKLTSIVAGSYDPETAAQFGFEIFNEAGDPIPPSQWPGYKTIETGLQFQNVICALKRDGQTRWFSLNSKPITKSGQNAALVSFFEITKQKEQKLQMRESYAFQKTLLENLDNGIVATDQNRVITLTNKKALEVLGLPGEIEDYIGKPSPDFHHIWKNKAAINQLVINTMQKGIRLTDEVETIDGKTIEARYIPFNFDKKFSGHIFEFVDISKRKKLERSLIKAKDAAEKANLAKSEFLSNMSHELRTPLNGVLGFAQLLELDGSLNEEQLDYVQEIVKGGQHLLQLINEILDLSRIESGKLKMNFGTVPVHKVISECIKNIEPIARKKNIMIRTEFDQCRRVFVMADPIRLKQILLNLLDNAIKYNRLNGEVIVSACIKADKLFIHVKDTGGGITEEEYRKVFMPFYRVDGTDAEGAGIGLPLVNQLVTLMGGDVGVASVVGEGSDFWFSLNIETKDGRQTDVHTERLQVNLNYGRQIHVLYVEDNESNIHLLDCVFNAIPDYNLVIARTGEEGLLAADQITFDLILLDFNLPDISGLEVFYRLKAITKTSEVPIVALSANAMPSDIKKVLEIGFTSYLTKPLDIKHFLNILERIVEPTSIN
ncbi:ATP-binding protein [Bacillus sp. T33-2]|uniref:ATP-binding protein n=1 Tax=Bacillus sp. T33-2 TaxID=2054168 RepID=UPI0015E0A4A2|nr:ATP-binding protein [Bacillus sp. T33-2]